jgi:hypothetical protein
MKLTAFRMPRVLRKMEKFQCQAKQGFFACDQAQYYEGLLVSRNSFQWQAIVEYPLPGTQYVSRQ